MKSDAALLAKARRMSRTDVRETFARLKAAEAPAPAPLFVGIEELGLAPAKGVLDLNQGNPVPRFVDLVTVYPEAPARYRRIS